MIANKYVQLLTLVLSLSLTACGNDDSDGAAAPSGPLEILVFSHTAGFRHASIADAVEFFSNLGAEEEINPTLTEDPAQFNDDTLAAFDVVVFANTTGDVLDDTQQAALQRFISAGGGYVGVHSAADTEHTWPWYGLLVGAYFVSHPLLPVEVEVTTEDPIHPSTAHLPDRFLFTDEIYNFDRNPRRDHSILLTIDEEGFIFPNIPPTASMGDDHPIAWYKEFEGGRSFYTNLGHRPETWRDPMFQTHLLEGIRWAATGVQFNRIVLSTKPRNPMELAVAPDGRVFYIERTGELQVWFPDNGRIELAALIDVDLSAENGLLGLTLDPDFRRNNLIYLYYSAPVSDPPPASGPPGRNILSRYEMRPDGKLELDSRVDLLDVPSERECCHEGGSLAFAPDGTLFLSLGDNTNPFPAAGYAPLDERPGKETQNSQRTAQNPFDLRGSILRINPDGSIPPGNLFPPDGSQGRPEIYTMGNRNPFRIAIDPNTGRLFWGEVGPDAVTDRPRGPRGYDEINFADRPGNYGWPHCIADNLPYADYDFETEGVGPPFSCDGFEPALLAYDYTTVTELALGNAFDAEGDFAFTGRTAIAGVFYQTPDRASFTLPEPFRDNLLMTEWTRDIIASVEVGEAGNLGRVTRMLPWESFKRPMDLAIGPDGALYVLEFGSAFFGDNPDAKLTRIEYSPQGELSPTAIVAATPLTGAAPLTVTFSSTGSRATGRNDSIKSYAWDVDADGRVDSRDPEYTHTYEENGTYSASLVVEGDSGRRSPPAVAQIVVGNGAPEVTILSPQDGTIVPLRSIIELRGEGFDPETGPVPCDDLTWDIRIGHNSHSHPSSQLTGCEAQFRAFLGGHSEGGTIFFAVELSYSEPRSPDGDEPLVGRAGIRIFVE
jgi:cytochrome c